MTNHAETGTANRRLRRILNFSFCFSLALGLLLWILAQRSWLLSGSWRSVYGITEWMINYQAGFVRRGLPGEILFVIGKRTSLDIGWLVLLLSLALYSVYFVLMVRETRGKLPLWALCSAPLLGFPVYSGDIIRKDVLLLLLLLASAQIIAKAAVSVWRQLLIATLAIAGLLSHESYLFFAIPACCLIDLLLTWNSQGRLGSLSKISFWSLAWLPPLAVSGIVLVKRATDLKALLILDSWNPLTPASAERSSFHGALYWLGKSPRYALERTHKHLSSIHFGIPLWLLVVIALVAAGIAIALLVSSGDDRAKFSFFLVVQILLMFPIFSSALDQGRWIFLAINSALILTISFTDVRLPVPLETISTVVEKFRRIVPPSLCVLILFVWGFPIEDLSLQGWLSSTPLFLVPIKVYLHLFPHGNIAALL